MTERLFENWKKVFGDPDGYVRSLLNLGAEVYEKSGVSSLLVLPMEYKGKKVGYVYGALTLPEHRGRGLMKQLLKETLESLEKKGFCAVFLLPADERLYGFYEKLGFKADLPTDCILTSTLPEGQEAEIPTEREYSEISGGGVKKPYGLYRFAAEGYLADGGHCIKCADGLLFYREHNGGYAIDGSDAKPTEIQRYAMSVCFGDFKWDGAAHAGLLME